MNEDIKRSVYYAICETVVTRSTLIRHLLNHVPVDKHHNGSDAVMIMDDYLMKLEENGVVQTSHSTDIIIPCSQNCSVH